MSELVSEQILLVQAEKIEQICVVKKTYPASKNARHIGRWAKHLRASEKRRVNKSTRRIQKLHLGGG